MNFIRRSFGRAAAGSAAFTLTTNGGGGDRHFADLDAPTDTRSPMSVWEAAIKRELGRLRAPRNLSAVLAAEFRMLDVPATLLVAAAELPRHHTDPRVATPKPD
jgi:hypothetical protein